MRAHRQSLRGPDVVRHVVGLLMEEVRGLARIAGVDQQLTRVAREQAAYMTASEFDHRPIMVPRRRRPVQITASDPTR